MAPPSQINLLCLAPNVMSEGRKERGGGGGQGAPFPLSKNFFFLRKSEKQNSCM